MSKIWHKPLHKRKVWKTKSLFGKTMYHLKPFIIHIIDTWQQPLPFPTLFKVLYSCILIVLVSLPLILPFVAMLVYYGIIQYFMESALDTVYPKNLDILHYTTQLFTLEVKNEKYIELLNIYLERWWVITTSFASCVDYVRLALALGMS